MISIFRIFVFFITHLVDNNIVVITAIVPSILVKALLLTVIELLHKASDKTLCNKTTFFMFIALLLTTCFNTLESNFIQFFHILAFSQDREERLLIHNILQNESGVHHSLVLFGAVKLLNERGNDGLFFLRNFCR